MEERAEEWRAALFGLAETYRLSASPKALSKLIFMEISPV
jgi:hypothetical protein